MFRDLGPTGRIAAVLALVAAATTLVAGVLFLDDVAALPPGVAADAWRTAAFALVSIAVTAVAIGLLLRALSDHAEQLALALEETRREREARQSELERVQAIVDSMADGVIFIDAEDRIALRQQGRARAQEPLQGPGRHVEDCHPRPPHGRCSTASWATCARGRRRAGPLHHQGEGGALRDHLRPGPLRPGEYLGTVMVIRDIAERRHLESRLLDAERLAGLGQMSAQIAHELRNPLNAIDGRRPVPRPAVRRRRRGGGVRRRSSARRCSGSTASSPTCSTWPARSSRSWPRSPLQPGAARRPPRRPRWRAACRPTRSGSTLARERAAASTSTPPAHRRAGQPAGERLRRRRRRRPSWRAASTARGARGRSWSRCGTAAAASPEDQLDEVTPSLRDHQGARAPGSGS